MSVDTSENNCNYIDLQAKPIRYERHLRAVIIKLNEIMQTFLKGHDYWLCFMSDNMFIHVKYLVITITILALCNVR